MQTYVSFVRDHSASMRPLVNGAANDFNLMLESVQNSTSPTHKIFGTVVGCGVGGLSASNNAILQHLTEIAVVPKVNNYIANGLSTPLWDAVGMAIDAIKNSRYFSQNDVAYLVMVITDGFDNASKQYSASTISASIHMLQNTDRWTFVFRVPKGSKEHLVLLGIPEGNIMEWEQNNDSLMQSTQATVAGISDYFTARAEGKTNTITFYTDLANVSTTEIKQSLSDVSFMYNKYQVYQRHDGWMIRNFIMVHLAGYTSGHAYYELTKSEKVQEKKKILIRERKTGKIYGGVNARHLLGLPQYGEIRLTPGDNGKYDIFVQSTSVNRKLVKNTTVLYQKS